MKLLPASEPQSINGQDSLEASNAVRKKGGPRGLALRCPNLPPQDLHLFRHIGLQASKPSKRHILADSGIVLMGR
jgi:hypothetical protein